MQLTEQRIREIVREELAAQQTATIQAMNKTEIVAALNQLLTYSLVESLQCVDGTP